MNCTIRQRDGANCPLILTSLVLTEYTKNMQGIDVVDQLMIIIIDYHECINGGINLFCFYGS